jgi:hypothetical protein
MWRLDLIGPGQGPASGFCEHGKEPSGSVTIEFLSRLSKSPFQGLCTTLFVINHFFI